MKYSWHVMINKKKREREGEMKSLCMLCEPPAHRSSWQIDRLFASITTVTIMLFL